MLRCRKDVHKTWERLFYRHIKNIYFHLLSENEIENASFLMPASLILCSSQKKMEVCQTVQPLNKICCCWLGALCELHRGRAWQSAASSCKQTWCMLLLIWTKDVTYKYVVSFIWTLSAAVSLCAATDGITAADFRAVPADSPLQSSRSTSWQHNSIFLICWLAAASCCTAADCQ